MTDRPILFSGPMVRALLDGRKTQTRRVLKPQPVTDSGYWTHPKFPGGYPAEVLQEKGSRIPGFMHFAPGDRLWVREALDMGFAGGFPICTCTYVADGAQVDLRPSPFWAGDQKRNRIPSIHMPRWASRLTLVVTDVRVQRLQDISEDDAVEESAVSDLKRFPDGGHIGMCARDRFALIWNSLHGSGAWAENPWVVAISFEVHRRNIDQHGKDAA